MDIQLSVDENTPLSLDIDWEKEPESTTDGTDDGYMYWKGFIDGQMLYSIRYKFIGNNRDLWTLEFLPNGQKWTREGFNDDAVCKGVARSYMKILIREKKKATKAEEAVSN